MKNEEFDELLESNMNDDNIMELLNSLGLNREQLELQEPEKLEFHYEKIDETIPNPEYAYESDSGFDLKAFEEVTIGPYSRAAVRTGLKFAIPDGVEIQVRPKSGLALNKGLTVLNTPGTVDSGYISEVVVIAFNTTNEPVTINKGMKIAQAVLCPVINGQFVKFKQVPSVKEIKHNSDRQENGFGSTGN